MKSLKNIRKGVIKGAIMNYSLCKYKNQWAIFCATTRCYVIFGTKKILEKRVKELNEMYSKIKKEVQS